MGKYYILFFVGLIIFILVFTLKLIHEKPEITKIKSFVDLVNDTLMRVLTAIMTVAVGFIVYEHQISQNNKHAKEKYDNLVLAEINENMDALLNDPSGLYTQVSDRFIGLKPKYIQTYAIEEASKTYLYDENQSMIMYRIIRDAHFHNKLLDTYLDISFKGLNPISPDNMLNLVQRIAGYRINTFVNAYYFNTNIFDKLRLLTLESLGQIIYTNKFDNIVVNTYLNNDFRIYLNNVQSYSLVHFHFLENVNRLSAISNKCYAMLQLVSNSTQTNHNSPFNSAAFKAELAIQFKRVQDIANDVTSSNSINGTILLEQMKKHLEDNNNIITLPIKSISPIDAFNTFSKTNSALMDYSNYYSMAMSNVTYILSH